MRVEDSKLWQQAFESKRQKRHAEERKQLVVALTNFRKKAALLAEEIPRDVAQLTDHSVRHLDALWQMADLIAGTVKFNPAEAFVFGGAVLLHDLANAVAAFPNGLTDLKGAEWDDLVHSAYLKAYSRRPTHEECEKPNAELYPDILLSRLRAVHAEQAERLATQGFFKVGGKGERIYLLDDEDLRDDFGPLIGVIAHSHHWPMSKVLSELGERIGTSSVIPSDWQVDALKIACVLRVADAMHLDSRRAPPIVRAFRRPVGESAKHWTFQERLLPPTVRNEQLVFESKRAFSADERDAWWLCYDTLKMVDDELHGVDAALRSVRDYRLSAHSVTSIGSPDRLAKKVRTQGWEPIDTRVRISDVYAVIERFGGRALYGNNLNAPIRELIGNARDAIHARVALTEREFGPGKIVVRLGSDETGSWLQVEDNGLGMSEEVLKGPLLDFGMTYWRSTLAQKEHPGLLSSGFSPTGRFGIGFFSVFMLGRKVRVVTRPYKRGEESTRVLEMNMAGNSRPFMRLPVAGDKFERMTDGGTRVRVYLDEAPQSEQGVLSGSGGEEEDARSLLSRLVGRVAPALDVPVFCASQEDVEPQPVINADDWKTLPFDQLVSRVEGTSRRSVGNDSPELTVYAKGQLVGRIQLETSYLRNRSGEFTVGGLSTLSTRGASFRGLLLAENPDLSRRDAQPLATAGDIRDAVGKSLDRFYRSERSSFGKLRVSLLLLGFGVRPEPLEIFILNGRFVAMEEVRGWLKDTAPGSSIRIVLSDDFEITGRYGNEETVDFSQCLDDWKQPKDIVIAAGSDDDGFRLGFEVIAQGVPPKPKKPLGFMTWGYERVPCSLAAWLAEEAAETWGVDPARMLASGVVKEGTIGELNDGAPIHSEYLILTRPDPHANQEKLPLDGV
ncbi:HD domain-containing protein [Myxococcus stipitatus]|uniref:HD domain-containing protein n=1 Tax=Myxococcus stipitatus TaxID=83455 RepID=UPI0030CE992D